MKPGTGAHRSRKARADKSGKAFAALAECQVSAETVLTVYSGIGIAGVPDLHRAFAVRFHQRLNELRKCPALLTCFQKPCLRQGDVGEVTESLMAGALPVV